jgi:hypothetical protein
MDLGMHAQAAEYGFSTYALGESAFSAGVTPPPGTYVTAVTGYFSGEIGGAVSFGGITLNAGVKADAFLAQGPRSGAENGRELVLEKGYSSHTSAIYSGRPQITSKMPERSPVATRSLRWRIQ